jgi:hypothetical protein
LAKDKKVNIVLSFFKTKSLLFRCQTLVSSNLTRNHKTRVERLGKDKHSSLSETLVNYGLKKYVCEDVRSLNVLNSGRLQPYS